MRAERAPKSEMTAEQIAEPAECKEKNAPRFANNLATGNAVSDLLFFFLALVARERLELFLFLSLLLSLTGGHSSDRVRRLGIERD